MRLIVFPIFLLLAACAATGPATYGPADDRGFGYSEQRIEDNRYRITYRGSGGMPPEMVEDYALRRAAELTLASEYEWFRVVGSNISGEERGGVSVGAGLGTGSYGRRSSVGVGVGGDLGRVGAQEYFTVRMDVLLGSGDVSEESDVYDARDVLGNLTGPEPYRYEEE